MNEKGFLELLNKHVFIVFLNNMRKTLKIFARVFTQSQANKQHLKLFLYKKKVFGFRPLSLYSCDVTGKE